VEELASAHAELDQVLRKATHRERKKRLAALKGADESGPALDASDAETPCPSDSEDYHRIGNNIPCRHYNNDGCARGDDCLYKHAADNRSVRDGLYVDHILWRTLATYSLT
jgi:hypothetical protein